MSSSLSSEFSYKSAVFLPTVTSDISYDSYDMDFTNITIASDNTSLSDSSHDNITFAPDLSNFDALSDAHFHNSSSATSSLVPLRQSSRIRKTPSYLSSYKCNLTQSDNLITSPHWCNMVRFDSLPSAHKAFLFHTSSITEPRSYKEASAHPLWREAIAKELKALADNHTWEIIDLPLARNLLVISGFLR